MKQLGYSVFKDGYRLYKKQYPEVIVRPCYDKTKQFKELPYIIPETTMSHTLAKKIIGVSGIAGSGKDTFALALKESETTQMFLHLQGL